MPRRGRKLHGRRRNHGKKRNPGILVSIGGAIKSVFSPDAKDTADVVEYNSYDGVLFPGISTRLSLPSKAKPQNATAIIADDSLTLQGVRKRKIDLKGD